MKYVSLLISHLPKQISGRDEPIKQLKTAVSFLQTQDVILMTSAGQTHWDCILTAALNYNIPTHLVIVKPMTISEVSEQFLCGFVKYDIVESQEIRDKFICVNSDFLYPLWLRSGGHLSQIISEFSLQLDSRFDCSSYRFRNSGLKYLLSGVSDEISILPNNYLWHWTRSKHGMWPNETRRNYCNDILNSDSPPRDAISTLKRILIERNIHASKLHIAANTPVTAFTANHPYKSELMFTWRKDCHQMNFEPYGIGIDIEYMIAKGTKKLEYGKYPNWDTMQADNRWKNENEWRYRGNFLLDNECLKKMIVVVRKHQEVEQIQKVFNGKIVVYEKNQ
ncbi:MAG: hypothetical protein LBE18_09040 [Planctomycetaceae bacterium]|jgi:hypothetical protein|nr:hypothetical protein [Planctomycetaceae bacterium]